MSGTRLLHVRAMRAAHAARRAEDDRRALVVRLVALHARADVALARLPGPLKLGTVALGIVAGEELAILLDARGDEVLGYLLEDRPAFLAVGGEQRVAAPALQLCLKLPA